jgi:DNA mismatch endonuclease (patch repair protein)
VSTTRSAAADPATSARMKQIRTSRTSSEREVERVLRRLGLRYRRNLKSLAGKPDFVIQGKRIALFVDGCFWHGCPKCFSGTQRNREWWAKKIAANRRRDRRVDAILRRNGYRVIHFWEHDLPYRVEKRLLTFIRR